MALTDAEEEEFIALSEATYDAALWDEADLPILRKAKREYEEQQVRERSGDLPSGAGAATFSPSEPLRPDATRVEPAALCPQVPSGLPFTDSEKQRHAECMSDEELARHVESKLRPVGESLRNNIAYIREARDRFAHPGRRVPVPGRPTFTEWIRQNLGISDRHVRRLLAGPKEPADRSPDAMEPGSNPCKRDEVISKAARMAHAVLGLDARDERDPLGVNRKAALKALAYQFLNLARRKHIPVVVRLKELQPADSRAIYGILAQCCDVQLDQVFGSLHEPERAEALRRLAQEIGNRYQQPCGLAPALPCCQLL